MRIVASLFVVFFFIVMVFPWSISAQEQSAPVVPGQLLVTYTDDAANVILRGVEVTPVPSVSTQVLQFFLSFLWLQSDTSNTQATDIKNKNDLLKQSLGVTSVRSMEEMIPTSHTIKLGTESFFPGSPGVKQDPLKNTVVMTFSSRTIDEAIDAWKKSGLVTSVQPNFQYQAYTAPNDPQYAAMWAHTRIQSEKAWNISTGYRTIIVAVVDSGVDYTHADLAPNIWTGDTGQGNGHGYDFVDGDGDPMDQFGHGTFVAGIIGAVGNNGKDTVGINWQTQIMPVRVLDPQGGGDTSTVSQGIRFAADHGAKVINISLGQIFSCSQTDTVMADVIQYAVSKGALVVAAAGNNRHNSSCDSPANIPEVLVVTARGSQDAPAGYSNYGIQSWKDTKILSAPGGDASSTSACKSMTCPISTKLGGGVTLNQGTSFASPYVAGLAALVLSVQHMDPMTLRQHLVATADDIQDDFTTPPNAAIPGDDGKRTYGKRINAFSALSHITHVTPTDTPALIPTDTPPVLLPSDTPPIIPSNTPVLIPTNTPIIIPTHSPAPTMPPAASPTRVFTTTVPSISPVPTPSSHDVDIWILIKKGGKIVRVKQNAKIKKGTKIAVCYNRDKGPYTITIDKGNGKISTIKGKSNSAKTNRCLSKHGERYITVGDYAKADGAKHIFQIESGGKTASVAIRVVQ